MDKDAEKRIEELQITEQQLQGIYMEKQTLQIELNESLNAIEELKKAQGEVYKILGGVMLKSDKETLIKELEEKKKIIELRINSLDKQEKNFEEKMSKLRKEAQNSVK